MKRKIFSTKTIVATALGAALFLVLFYFIKVPSPVPNTNIQLAYGITTFFGALFGPIAGFLIGFVGHALNDFIAGYGIWWSWVIASGVAGLFSGLAFFTTDLDHGQKPGASYYLLNIIGQAAAWIVVAPVLDILMYNEPVNLVFVQGLLAFVANAITALVVGTVICYAYAATRSGNRSLDKE